MALLEVAGVTVSFGGLTALDDVSLAIESGQVLGLIGPNGAGKTTLFNVVCGFVRPQRGEVRWEGRVLRRFRPHQLSRLGIARTLQGLGLFPHLTALENVLVGADRLCRARFVTALSGLPGSDRDERALRARALAVLGELDIADAASRLPGVLPYGVQKRVALARALVAEPRLLLLDEPASGLSEAEMAELGELIRSLRERMAVMVVEHHMDLVMAVCEQLVVLDFGRVIASGSPGEVQANPAVQDAYLGELVSADTGQASHAAEPPNG